MNEIKRKVNEEIKKHKLNKELKTYVGRTKDENIQIVILANDSDATTSSHFLSSVIAQKLKG